VSFDFKKYMSALNYTKEIVFDENDTYSSFLVNRCFINYPDTVLHAYEVSLYMHNIPDEMNFAYWIGAIPKRKRFSKFPKKKTHEHEESVMWAYDISRVKAREYISYMSEESLSVIDKDYKENNP
jgi:hypothetical protein